MKDSKPLLFIQSVNTETRGKYQDIYDSRKIRKKEKPKRIDPTILRKVELLTNRAKQDQPVLCNIITDTNEYKGIVIDTKEGSVVIEQEDERISRVQLSKVKEIRIIKIDY